MADPKNMVSVTLPQEKLDEMIEKIRSVHQALPGLVSLDGDGRRSLLRPGDSVIDALESVLVLAERHPALFPREITDLEELRRDLALIRQFEQLLGALNPLTQAIEDTLMAAKSDFARNGYYTYHHSKTVRDKIPGYEAAIESLQKILDRAARKSGPAAEQPPAGG